MISLMMIFRYSTGFSPAFRHHEHRFGDVLSVAAVEPERGGGLVDPLRERELFTLTLPAPPPPPVWDVPDWDIPQLQAMTSISALCLSSRASPLISPIFKNMSIAIGVLSFQTGGRAVRPSGDQSPVSRSPYLRSISADRRRHDTYLHPNLLPSAYPPFCDGSFETSRSETVSPSS